MAQATEQHQAAQAGLVVLLHQEIARLFPSIVQRVDLEQEIADLAQAVWQTTQQFASAGAAIASDMYTVERAAAGVPGVYTPPLPYLPPFEKVEEGVRWATHTMWTEGDVDLEPILSNVQGVAEKATLDTSRELLIDAVREDKEARAWARVPEAGCCYFCAMLATRGAVYQEETAGFEAHDHCRCHVEPVFNVYEPSAQIREWEGLYKASVKGVHGSEPARKAFRAAYYKKYGL